MHLARSIALRAALALSAAAVTGCGVGLLHAARTTPPGQLDVTLGGGYLRNAMVEERGHAVGNFPSQVGLRYGLDEQLDLGLSLFAGAGGQLDAKYNLLAPAGTVAASVLAGLGAAYDVGSGALLLHVPLRLLASVDLFDDELTPYGGAGYGFFWVFGYGEPTPGVRYAARAGHGDGLLMLTGGVQLWSRAPVSLLVEYSLLEPIVDDPGDFYAFSRNHLLVGGVRF